jgi:DNA polymerase III alpha subunit
MKTVLKNRTLWYDGTIQVPTNNLMKWLSYNKVAVTELTDDILKYNKNVMNSNKILVKDSMSQLDTSWNIPQFYHDIDIETYINDALIRVGISDELSDTEFVDRYKRVQNELTVFIQLELIELLKTLIYIIDSFKDNNVVWGVGRGSSVSSYILYLLEVHDIDSVTYELDFNEFLRY